MCGASYDRRPADVHGHPSGFPQAERRHIAGGGVVELEHAGYGNPIMSVHVTGSTGGAAGPSGIPEKPGLEGLEATWSSRWEEDGTYAFDRTASRERRLLHRHPASHRVRLAPHRPRLLLHPHRYRGPLPPDAGPSRLLPDGVGRQRPAHRAAGAELLRGPLRSRPALRSRLRAAGPAGQGSRLHLPPQLRGAVPPAHRGGRAGLRAPVAHARPVGGLDAHLRHRLRPGPAGLPTRFPAPGRPGPGGPADRAHPLGRRLPDGGVPGRAGGPRAARRPTTGSDSPASAPRAGSTSRRPGPSCCRPASPWWPTPTTSATGRCSAPR